MIVKKRNTNNPFIDLVNYKMHNSNLSYYSNKFIDMNNEPSRLEHFLSVGSINFIDDTKAQSVNAIWYSIENMNCPVTLILKDFTEINEYLRIKQLLRLKVKGIVSLSKNEVYANLLLPLVGAIHFTDNLEDAVRWAYENTEKNDAVLYSPGVKVNVSYESFLFKNAVRNL